jgi:hypothetical protein
MFTRFAVFDSLGPPCRDARHEWRILGTWTVYCRRCYHHHRKACRCPACAPASARKSPQMRLPQDSKTA